MKPKIIIFVGINGAGKSSLYEKYKEKYGDVDYINPDNIVKNLGLDCKEELSYIKASRIAFKMILEDLDLKKDMVVETTTFPRRIIMNAKELGYEITTHYILVDDITTSLNRIQKRINEGGHGVSESYLRLSFDRQQDIMQSAITLSDHCLVYTNKADYNLIAEYKDGIRITDLTKD